MTENDLRERPCAEPRIAICTALPEELAACRLVIDELAALNPGHPDDGNQYWCGTLPSREENGDRPQENKENRGRPRIPGHLPQNVVCP